MQPAPSTDVLPVLGELAANQGSNRYVTDLWRRVLGSASVVYDPDFALTEDPEIYAKILRDPVIADAMQERLHKVAGRDIVFAADDARAAAAIPYMEWLTAQIGNFRSSRYNLARAVLEGMRCAQIRGEFRTVHIPGDAKPRRWWIPTGLVDVSKQRLRQQPIGRTGKTRWTMYSVTSQSWRVIERPEWFVWHVYANSESSVGYGDGLGSSLYYYWYLKTLLLEFAARACERFGEGMLVAFVEGIEGTRGAGGRGKTVAQIQTEWQDVLEKCKARNVAVFPSGSEVRTMEPSGTAHQMLTELIRYCDEAIQNLLQGMAPSDGGVGSYAREVEKGESADDVISYDHQLMSESLNRWLVSLIWRLNAPNFGALGFLGIQPPRLKIRLQRRDNPETQISIIERALTAGVALKTDEVYDRIDFTKPAPGDETISAPAPTGGFSAARSGGDIPDSPRWRAFAESAEAEPKPERIGPGRLSAFDELEKVYAHTARRLQNAVRGLSGRIAESIWTRGNIVLQADPDVREMAETIRKAQAFADILGRIRMLREIEGAGENVNAPAEPATFAAEPEDLPAFLDLPFDEGIENLTERIPILADTAQEIRELYSEGNVFGVVRSATEVLTARVQNVLTDALEVGKPFESFADFFQGVEERGFDRTYAKTVFRTNLNTAYTAGRVRAAESPALKGFVVGFEYVSAGRGTNIDGDSRPNHDAAHGFRAPVDDPRWNGLTPPLGYNCRCTVRTITRIEAKRRGWLDDAGALKPHEPRNFARAHADYSTFGSKPQ